ncbi:RNA polymerase sigma factor [Portibacter marinus]|uniref:RNA polymerase sigma factor n=1 Tax=Portibacter marinus TaxID=2898660 RepID=UPI001F456928|nr:sigma-70 family RNA polymerase sigma factor [Portibacter marinus]
MKNTSVQTDLVRLCIRGDRRSQQQLYQLYSKAMFNICLRMMGNRMDAEDVLQVSFIDIFKNLKKYRGEASVGSWIKRIVINNCLNQIRKNKIIFEDIPDSASEITVENDEKVQYDIAAVHKAIQQLPDGYRTILNLYLLEGYSHDEISEILDISTSTSKSQFSRAKAKLRELIKSRDHLKMEL